MRNIILAFALPVLFFSCGGENKKAADETVEQELKTQKEATNTDANNMTVEKYCRLELDQAKLLMDKYWKTFKGKDYSEVKDAYKAYDNEKDELLKKYGVTNEQKLTYFARDNKDKIKEYRKAHPEYDIYTNYPEFQDANVQLYHYAEAKYKENKKN